MTKFQINIPKELLKRLKRYAVDHDTDMTTIALQLITDFLDKAEKKKKR